MRVRLYKKTKDNQSYFQFRADDERVILDSQGYTNKDARNNGVRSVVSNANNADRYDRQTADGKHFFIIKAGNNQEIARSVMFDDEAGMESAIAMCIAEIPKLAAKDEKQAEAAPAAAATTAKEANPYKGDADGDDNYKPLSFYQANSKGTADGFDTFASEDGANFYFTFKRGGNITLISESYTSQSGRNNGVQSVTKNLPIAERYQRKVHPNGKHYFNLLAGNNQEIATSAWFDSEDDMNAAITALQSGGGARIAGAATGDLAAMESGYQASVNIEAAPVVETTDADKPKKKRKKRVKKEPKQEKVMLKSGSYLFNDVTYQTMQSGNGKYYFSFRNAEGKSILLNANVRGFDTEEDVDAGVQRVMEFGPNEANYLGKTTKNGKYYFYLRDTEEKNIGKSFFFNTPEEMQTAIGLLVGRGLAAAAPAATGSGVDEYLPCEAYASTEEGFHKFFHAEGEEWYFGYSKHNGKTYLRSEGYTTEKARDNGIASVIKNAPLEERWKMIEEDGSFYYALRAGNNQEIARSCPFADAIARDRAWEYLTGDNSPIGFGSVDRDGVRWSVAMVRKEEEDAAAAAKAAEEEAKRKAEAEAAAKKKAEEEAAAKAAEEEAKRKAEAEAAAKKKAEEEAAAKAAAEAEAKRKAEEAAAKKKAEEEAAAKKKAEEETAAKAAEEEAAAKRKVLAAAEAAAVAKAAVEAAKRKDDDYLACKEYQTHVHRTSTSNPDFATFEKDGEYYFAWVEDGKVLMRSEGYTTEKARDNGIASVTKNRELEERYSIDEKMNYFFVVLKAGNHQEIARSCPFKERAAAMALYPSEREKARSAKLAAAAPAPKAERQEDDYLACKVYKSHINDVSEKYPGFITFEEGGEHYFAWVENGDIVLRSEGYTTTKARDNGIESVMKNREEEKRFSIDEKMGYYFLVLKAGNHQEIGRGCPHKDKDWVMGWYPSGRSARMAVAATAVAAAAMPEIPTVTPEEKEDDYLPCSFYEGHSASADNNVALFKHATNGQFYFVIYNKDGGVRLRSEGFETTVNRDDELQAALKHLDNKESYKVLERGKYRMHILYDENGREVGRSCLERIPAAVVPPAEKEDDYLKCSEYEGRKVNDKENNVALFKHENGQFYFAVYRNDGSVRIRSEGFGDARERDVELSGVLKNLNNDDMYETIERGKYSIRVLKDKTGREVGRSCLIKKEEPVAHGATGAAGAVGAAAAGAAAAVVIPSATPEEKEDDYLPCSAYEGHTVTDKENNLAYFEQGGQSYFVIYNEDGSVRLRSEGFETTANRDDELEAAIKHLSNKEMYTVMEWGKYRLHILKDENGREVGRSCLERIPAAVVSPAEKEDDYLKCSEYQGRKINDKENRVALFKHKNGQFYFAVYDKDGNVRIRSEGFRDAKERDVELSGVLKNIDNDDMYDELRKGNYKILVLKDKTGREVGRSCLIKDKKKVAVPPKAAAATAAAAAAVAAATTASAAPPPPPKKKKVVAATTPPPPIEEKAGGFPWKWLWLLLPLLLLLLWWNGCFGCDGCSTTPPPPPKVEEPAPKPEPAPEPAPEPEPEPAPVVCDCNGFGNGMFKGVSTANPKSLTKLGTYPEFGNSHSLDPAGFYNKLAQRHKDSRTDRLFLDKLFKEMGYANGFADANAGMFSNTTVTPGTVGYMGYGRHQTKYKRLDTTGDDLKAFRIEASNGCHMHFMKTCGNHFFFCSK